MFDLNPLAQPNAWWQHMVMIVGAGIIGYIIGYRKSSGTAAKLEHELGQLDAELDECRSSASVEIVEEPMVSASLGATPVAATVAPVVTPPISTKPDNLKLIEGIGPKIEQLLRKEGIQTFRELSTTPAETILRILRAAGPRFQMHDPGTWPKQAEFAADEKWEELGAFQNALNKGRST